ncbi:hypothetical protein KEM52_006242 [Ascosphaera acerosa]|nr:hypothetical protein KEM52_006242 [Ascosphaera acerosa]
MAPKKENAKKAAGNARVSCILIGADAAGRDYAEQAAQKQAAADQKKAVEEAEKWAKGAKSNSKKDAAEAKKAEAARKKAEREALLKEEEANAPAKPKAIKTAQKKYMPARPSKVVPLVAEDAPVAETIDNTAVPVNSSGIDASKLEKLDPKAVERHPERRYKAAFELYEERRMPQLKEEQPGLRKNQRLAILKKEFEKHPDNPFNQLRARYNASLDEVQDLLAHEKAGATPDRE